MSFARLLATTIGAVAALMGLLWAGQRLGIITWPESSFMLADRQGAVNGAVLAAFGIAAIWAAIWLTRKL